MPRTQATPAKKKRGKQDFSSNPHAPQTGNASQKKAGQAGLFVAVCK